MRQLADVEVSPILAPKTSRHRTRSRCGCFKPKLPRQILEHFEVRTFFSNAPKIPVKHERGTQLFGQRSLQMRDLTGSVHRLHVSACGSPSAAALEAGLMEQEQHYPYSAVLQ